MKKRIFALILSLILSLSLVPGTAFAATVIDSGYCGGEGDGTNLTWTLDSDGVLTISGTGEMADGAFYDCDDLTSVTIPNSVTSIGDEAFHACDNLTSITIPNSVTSIGDSAFYHCDSLTSISIPDSVTWIGDDAFGYCYSLTSITIPNSVTSIGVWAFDGCTSLRSITIPSSVTWICRGAFDGCDSLTDVYYSGTESQWKEIDIERDNIALNKESTTIHYITVLASGYCGGEGDGTNLTWTLDSDGLLTISGTGEMENTNDPSWYDRCNEIKTVTINSGVTSIGDWAFANCDSLTSLTMPDSVTSIGEWSFASCNALRNFTIPDSVTSIGESAFSGCTILMSITIPNSVTSIGVGAFDCCYSLTGISVSCDNQYYASDAYGVLFDKNETALLQYPIGNTRTSYTIPNTVTRIGDWAFANCASLTSLAIPENVTSIGTFSFQYCDSLASIIILNSVTSIGDGAFYECVSLTDVYYSGTEDQWNAINIDCENEALENAQIHFNSVLFLTLTATEEAGGTTIPLLFNAAENELTVQGDIPTGESLYIAQYDENGKFLGVAQVTDSGTTVSLNGDSAAVFWLNTDMEPKCEEVVIPLD